MPRALSRRAPSTVSSADSREGFVLLALVLVFILCQSIRLIFKGFEILFIDKHLSEEAFLFCERSGQLHSQL